LLQSQDRSEQVYERYIGSPECAPVVEHGSTKMYTQLQIEINVEKQVMEIMHPASQHNKDEIEQNIKCAPIT
jgi:hypothetical protein